MSARFARMSRARAQLDVLGRPVKTLSPGTYRAYLSPAAVAEIQRSLQRNRFFFFVDDNIASSIEGAKELYRALIPLNIRWVSQASINVAHDEELLDLLRRSGCKGLLIGFESLDEQALGAMNKSLTR